MDKNKKTIAIAAGILILAVSVYCTKTYGLPVLGIQPS